MMKQTTDVSPGRRMRELLKNALAVLTQSLDEGCVIDRPDLLVSFGELNTLMGLPRIKELEALDAAAAAGLGDIVGARPLLILGDNVTTDHISPGGDTATVALKCRVDTSVEAQWLRNGGILPNALRTLAAEAVAVV